MESFNKQNGKKTILIITDGIGYSSKTKYNAFYHAKKPNYDYLFEHVPYSMIRTYGMDVGLPKGQMGNSEVGHMCIGSGRVLYQDLVKIALAIQNDEIKTNKAFRSVLDSLKEDSTLHLCGLISDGGVHSHHSHTIALAQVAANEGKKVNLHLLSDGRDVRPQSFLEYYKDIKSLCDKSDGKIKVATLSGRFYAMDRDKRWERIQKAYDAMMCATPKTSQDVESYVKSSYEKGVFDEFIEPTSFDGFDGIKDGDGFVFVNFRSDRAREIVDAICNPNFNSFTRKKSSKLCSATMTEYEASFPYPIMFEKDKVENTLAQVISQNNLTQGHTAETEKYAHVTFFLNGGVESEFKGERRILIPSPKVKTYDEKPEMSASAVGDAVIEFIEEGRDFIVVNFANGDMVGHTGVLEAGIKAVEAVDYELGRIMAMAKLKGYSLIITSDHGNCEEMMDENGNVLTNHTVGDVWCFCIDDRVSALKNGALNNIAPSVLKLMGIERPKEMSEALF